MPNFSLTNKHCWCFFSFFFEMHSDSFRWMILRYFSWYELKWYGACVRITCNVYTLPASHSVSWTSSHAVLLLHAHKSRLCREGELKDFLNKIYLYCFISSLESNIFSTYFTYFQPAAVMKTILAVKDKNLLPFESVHKAKKMFASWKHVSTLDSFLQQLNIFADIYGMLSQPTRITF